MGTKFKIGIAAILLLVMVGIAIRQQMEIQRLAAENADLRVQLGRVASLQETNDNLATELKAAMEAAQANQNEVLLLRGQNVKARQM